MVLFELMLNFLDKVPYIRRGQSAVVMAATLTHSDCDT